MQRIESDAYWVGECIINEVKLNPAIWDNSREDYKDNEKRKVKFQEIAKALGVGETFVKTRWRSLRDKYMKEKNRESSSVASGCSMDNVVKSSWPHMKSMAFLAPSVEPRPAAFTNMPPVQPKPMLESVLKPSDSSSALRSLNKVSTLRIGNKTYTVCAQKIASNKENISPPVPVVLSTPKRPLSVQSQAGTAGNPGPKEQQTVKTVSRVQVGTETPGTSSHDSELTEELPTVSGKREVCPGSGRTRKKSKSLGPNDEVLEIMRDSANTLHMHMANQANKANDGLQEQMKQLKDELVRLNAHRVAPSASPQLTAHESMMLSVAKMTEHLPLTSKLRFHQAVLAFAQEELHKAST